MATFEPIVYAINDNSDYVYHIEWIPHLKKWAIRFAGVSRRRAVLYVTIKGNIDYFGSDGLTPTATFDSPDSAFEFWVKMKS